MQVDAVVTDSKNHPVTNLQAKDFEILQDGVPQVITNLSYIREAAPDTGQRPTSLTKNAVAPPPRELKPQEIRRVVALVVDDLGLSFERPAYVHMAMKKFVDEQMLPGDLVAILRTGGGIGTLQQFTSDKRLLYAAIDRVKFNAQGRVGISSFEPLAILEYARRPRKRYPDRRSGWHRNGQCRNCQGHRCYVLSGFAWRYPLGCRGTEGVARA